MAEYFHIILNSASHLSYMGLYYKFEKPSLNKQKVKRLYLHHLLYMTTTMAEDVATLRLSKTLQSGPRLFT
jgi:hypothetical protein